MSAPSHRPRRGARERLAAWLVTGPLGHLYSALADIATLGGRLLARSLRRRLAGRS